MFNICFNIGLNNGFNVGLNIGVEYWVLRNPHLKFHHNRDRKADILLILNFCGWVVGGGVYAKSFSCLTQLNVM